MQPPKQPPRKRTTDSLGRANLARDAAANPGPATEAEPAAEPDPAAEAEDTIESGEDLMPEEPVVDADGTQSTDPVDPPGEPEPAAEDPELEAEAEPESEPESTLGKVKVGRIKLVGSRLGHKLTVGKRLGRGMLGEVYNGVHPLLARRFAIKVIRSTLTNKDKGAQERLKILVRDASLVEHPGMVSLLDFGQLTNERFYIVMELARGIPLSRAMAESDRFSVVRTLSLLVQLAEALDAAHRLRLVHGDVKPSNIYLVERPDGDLLKLADLGLVQALSRERTQEDPVAHLRCCSTLSYVSPEQITARRLDARSDIYSFGAVAYHMLTGSPPFSGAPAQVVRAHRGEEPEPPSARVKPGLVPAALDVLVLRCLQKHPQDRFESLANVAQQLVLLLEGIQQQTFDPGGTPPPIQRRRQRTSAAVPAVGAQSSTEEPLPESQDQLRRLFFDGLFHLGEKVTEAGKGSEEMDEQLSELRQLRMDLQTRLERCDDTERRSEQVRQEMRERESTLRYAIIDLNLMLSDRTRQGNGGPEKSDIEFQIAELERSLGRIEKEYAGKFQVLNGELRQHRDSLKPLEQQMALHYRKLYALLDEVREKVSNPEAQQLYRLIMRCRNALTQSLDVV